LRPSALLLLLATSGCDFIFRLDPVPTPAIDASTVDLPGHDDGPEEPTDAPVDAPAKIACGMTVVDDTFAGPTPCANWGSFFATNANVTSGGGQLVISVTSTATEANGGCNSNQYLFAGAGVIAHMTSVTTGNNSYNGLQVAGSSLDAALNVNMGTLKFQTRSASTTWVSATYDATAMAWLRLWPDRTTSEVVADYSPDGQTWTELGRRSMNLPQMATFSIIGGVNQGGIYSGSTRFSRFMICQ